MSSIERPALQGNAHAATSFSQGAFRLKRKTSSSPFSVSPYALRRFHATTRKWNMRSGARPRMGLR
jgi:hypothetical protein